jgi:cell division protein FtsL
MRTGVKDRSVKHASDIKAQYARDSKSVHAREDKEAHPVLRLRMMLIGLCVLVVCMAGPLVLVWKQSYINQASIRLESKAEALAAQNREITALRLECGRLSATPRIERMAKERGFEYPPSSRMVVLDVKPARKSSESGVGGFFARVLGFVLRERGS